MKNQNETAHAEDCTCGQCQAKKDEALNELVEDFLEVLKNTPDALKFTLQELVSFGEYMVSDQRKASRKLQGTKQLVTHADITNWRESFYPKWIEKHIADQN